MKIHRYFFWIEDNFIEIYKDGKLERYDGEDRTYVKKLDDFWKKWESNSKIILSDEKIDFTFLIDEKIDKESKNIKKVRFKYNDEELTIVKTEEKYIKAELDDDLIKISILGNNVNVDILKEISNQRVEKKEKKEYKTGRLSSFFRKKREEE